METLIERLKSLRAKKGKSIDASDMDALLAEVVAALGSLSDQREMVQEIEAIAVKIRQAKEDMRAISSDEAGGQAQIKGANLELDEVIRATEEASNKIMDAAEKIQALVPENAEAVAQVMQIFEACSFQDITGQRIRKVLGLLAEVETGIQHLMALSGVTLGSGAGANGGSSSGSGRKRPAAVAATGRAAEEALGLLNGPQLGKDQSSQDDIDRLFSQTSSS